jgi:hypothetical protein
MATPNLKTFFEAQPVVVSRELEIETYALSLACAPWPFPDELKIDYSNVFYRAIFDAIASAGIPIRHLSFTGPEEALQINKRQGGRSTGWFGISYKEPGKGFGITIDDQVFQIRCDNILLKDLVYLVDSVFSRITAILRSDGLAKPILLDTRAHSVDHNFEIRLRLGNHKVQQRPVKNFEILTEALSLNRTAPSAGTKAVSDALTSVGAERFMRMDFKQHVLKTIDGVPFITGFIIEAPFNENNSVLDITTFVRSEEESKFNLDAGLNWDTAFTSFFRDIFLKRFLDNLLCSTGYTNH